MLSGRCLFGGVGDCEVPVRGWRVDEQAVAATQVHLRQVVHGEALREGGGQRTCAVEAALAVGGDDRRKAVAEVNGLGRGSVALSDELVDLRARGRAAAGTE